MHRSLALLVLLLVVVPYTYVNCAEQNNAVIEPWRTIRNSLQQTVDAFQQPIVHHFFEQLLPLKTEDQKSNEDAKNELVPEWFHDMANLVSGEVKYTPPIEVPSNDSAPRVPKDICDPKSLYVGFEYTLYACNGTNVTFPEYEKRHLYENCTATNATNYICVCPLDRVGKECNDIREFTCSVNLISPNKQCVPVKKEDTFGGLDLDVDTPCFQFNSTQVDQDFTFSMNCSFDNNISEFENYTNYLNVSSIRNVTIITHNNTIPTTWEALPNFFHYFLNYSYPNENKTFALLTPLEKPFEFQIYNFHALGASINHPLMLNATEYYIGQRTMMFNTKLALPAEYLVGNRIYLEAGVFDVYGATMLFQRLFLDFPELTEPVYYDGTDLIYATVIPASVLLVAGIIGAAAFFYTRNKQQQEEFFHGIDKKKSD